MRDSVRQFKTFREEADLPFCYDYLPRNVDALSLAEIDEAYHKNQARAEAAEAKAQQQLAAARAPAPGYVTIDEAHASLVALAEQIRDEAIYPLCRRIDKLESEALSFAGVYREGLQFRRNQLVQHKSQVWLTVAEHTGEEPGKGPGFRLLTKGAA
jgi:hypothetical protein